MRAMRAIASSLKITQVPMMAARSGEPFAAACSRILVNDPNGDQRLLCSRLSASAVPPCLWPSRFLP